MAIILIILSILLWCTSLWLLFRRPVLAPGISYLALLALSFARTDGVPLLPINGTILTGWLCMTIVVMAATVMQPLDLRKRPEGTAYLVIGALAGMVLGLLGYSAGESVTMKYGIMIVATAAGVFMGYVLFGNTPAGRALRAGSGNMLRMLPAKGFPIAITVMQIGVALVLALALYMH